MLETLTGVCEQCSQSFNVKRKGQKYCTSACQYDARNAKRRRGPNPSPQRAAKPIDALLTIDEHVAQLDEQEHLRSLKKDVQEKIRLAAFQQRVLSMAADLLPQYEPKPLRQAVHTSNHKALVGIAVFSDWHIGQYTTFSQTGEVFEQTTQLAENQIDLFVEKFKEILAVKRKGHPVEAIYPLFLGDLTEGVLRPRAAVESDMLHMRQAFHAMRCIDYLLREFEDLDLKVNAHMVGGNHDRTSQKAGNAGLGELAYDEQVVWLIGQFLQHQHANRDAIDIKVWDSFYGREIIAGRRFAFEHGASFRWSSGSYGGVPYYAVANAARGYIEMLNGADVIVMGHGHIPNLLTRGKTNIVMNGALPPSTSWVQSSFKQVIPPCQVLLWFHEEIGFVGYEPIWLDVGQVSNSDAIWHRPGSELALA